MAVSQHEIEDEGVLQMFSNEQQIKEQYGEEESPISPIIGQDKASGYLTSIQLNPSSDVTPIPHSSAGGVTPAPDQILIIN